jgi:hypothetical protein
MTSSYVKIFYYDKNAKKNKPINIHLVSNENLNKDGLLQTEGRPKVGFVGLDLSTNETSAAMITIQVTLKFKVYDKSVLNPGGILHPFFYPEWPFGIEYGLYYDGPNPDPVVQKLLNWRITKMCNPTHYDINIDEKGIYEFNVNAVTGANHAFNKFSIGSFMLEQSDEIYDDYTEAYANLKAIEEELADYQDQKDSAQKKSVINKINSKINQNKKMHTKASKDAQDILTKVLANKLSDLKQYKRDNVKYKSKTKGKKKESTQSWLSIGDIVRVICMSDLEIALHMYSTKDNVKVGMVWSRFGDYAGDYAGKPIYDFLIPYDNFVNDLREFTDLMTQPTIRLDALFDVLKGYLNDETLYKLEKKQETYENFTQAEIVDYIQHDIKSSGEEYISYNIVDKKRGIDFITQISEIIYPPDEPGWLSFDKDGLKFNKFEHEDDKAKSGTGYVHKPTPLSKAETRNLLRKNDVAYIQMLEANSFVKSLRMSVETDENVVNISMSKMYGSKSSLYEMEREGIAIDKQSSQGHATKIRLPLHGTLEVIGHPMWEPMKTMYLFAENEEWNGFYFVNSTTLSFSVGLPKSTLELMYQKYNN